MGHAQVGARTSSSSSTQGYGIGDLLYAGAWSWSIGMRSAPWVGRNRRHKETLLTQTTTAFRRGHASTVQATILCMQMKSSQRPLLQSYCLCGSARWSWNNSSPVHLRKTRVGRRCWMSIKGLDGLGRVINKHPHPQPTQPNVPILTMQFKLTALVFAALAAVAVAAPKPQQGTNCVSYFRLPQTSMCD